MSEIKATTTNVIYKNKQEADAGLKVGSIELTDYLSKDTMWAEVVVPGADSELQPGDDILLSRRVVSYDFKVNGETLHNTSDASIMAYKRNGELKCTCGTILYELITTPEEVTQSGIIIARKEANKERDPVWCKVVAAGPKSTLLPGDEMLIAYKSDCYRIKIEVNGVMKELRNAGSEEIILYRRPTN